MKLTNFQRSVFLKQLDEVAAKKQDEIKETFDKQLLPDDIADLVQEFKLSKNPEKQVKSIIIRSSLLIEKIVKTILEKDRYDLGRDYSGILRIGETVNTKVVDPILSKNEAFNKTVELKKEHALQKFNNFVSSLRNNFIFAENVSDVLTSLNTIKNWKV
jgi:hypothetical protein